MKSRGCVSSSLPHVQEDVLCGSCAFNGHMRCRQLLAILPKDSSTPSPVHHMVCIGVRGFAPPQSCVCTTAFSLVSLQRWLCKALVCASVWTCPRPVPYSPTAGPHHPSTCSPVLPSSVKRQTWSLYPGCSKIQVSTGLLGSLDFPSSSYYIQPVGSVWSQG